MLRALGATQRYVLLAYMTEAAILSLAGGLAGVVLAAVVIYFFHDLLVSALGFTILLPSVAEPGRAGGRRPARRARRGRGRGVRPGAARFARRNRPWR